MRVLLDTNIVIHREANRVINENIGQLFLWLDKLKYQKCIHNLTIDEISKYQDADIKKTMLIKMQSYELLSLTLPLHSDVKLVSDEIDKNENDIIDTKILNEVFCGRVDLLITEDKKINNKAIRLGIGNKVKTINAFLEWVFVENPALQDYKIKNIRIEKFGNINLDQSFFESLKHDYGSGFVTWYKRNYDKEAYVCGENNNITAFLSLKIEGMGTEDYSNITPAFMPKKRLKIRTMKVAANGYKIGERFLKIIFDNALKNKVDEIYVTLFQEDEDKKELAKLFETYGFVYWGKKDIKEDVYIRDMVKVFNANSPTKSYPYIEKNRDVFLITINSKYHTNLFPDSIIRTEKPDEYLENKPYSNAIRKYFITRAYTAKPKIGDIIVFYRTAGSRYTSAITTVGVVADYKERFRSFYEFYTYCSRRSVLSEAEMKEVWDRNLYCCPKVIDFLYIDTLFKKINLDKLIELGFNQELIKEGIIKLPKHIFNDIIELSSIDKNRLI